MVTEVLLERRRSTSHAYADLIARHTCLGIVEDHRHHPILSHRYQACLLTTFHTESRPLVGYQADGPLHLDTQLARDVVEVVLQ